MNQLSTFPSERRSCLPLNGKLRFLRMPVCAAATAAVVLAATTTSRAVVLSWNPTANATANTGGTGTWDLNTTADWYNGTADQTWTDSTGTADIATFGGTAGTVTLNSSLGALGLVFTTTGYTITGANTLSLGASGLDASALTSGTTALQNGTGAGVVAMVANQAWNVGTGATVVVGASSNPTTTTTAVVGGVTGAFTLTKNGAGALVLEGGGNDSFSGGLTINAGTVSSTVTGGFGTGQITLNGGTLGISNQGNVASFVGNAINVTSASTITSSNKSNGISGALTGSANLALALTNAGTFTPTGSMSAYTGVLNVTSTGSSTLRLAAGFVGPTNGTVTLNSGITMSNNTSTSGTITYLFGSLNAGTGTFITPGGATGAGAVIESIGAANLNNTIASTLSDGTTLHLGITKTGTGSLVLSGTNTNTGAMTVTGGSLLISADANLGAVATATAATLNGGALVGTATFTLDNAGANARGVTLTATTGGTLAATTGNTMTVDGVVTGTGPLAIGTGTVVSGTTALTGNGVVALTAANNYSGLTTINAGTLNINGVNALGGAFYAGLTINGGILQYATGRDRQRQPRHF